MDETADRDIGLVAPITYRPGDDAAESVLDGVGLVVVRAERIKYLTITYLELA